MICKLSNLVEKRPWLVVGIVIMITMGFGAMLPFLEMGTSTEDFMPDDEIVKASQRVAEYFGGSEEMMMIYVEAQEADNAVSPKALREEYLVSKELEKIDEIGVPISVAGFVEIICQIEFGKSLLDCSNDEIGTAFQDLMAEPSNDEIQMMGADDPNGEVDYNAHPRISKGKSIGSIDVKNYYIREVDDKLYFSIEVYDLSQLESKLKMPSPTINVMEWYISFKNLIIPDERLDMDFKIAAHIEPKKPLWDIGAGVANNVANIFNSTKNGELFNSYKKEAYLWIRPSGQDMSFPVALKTGNVSFNIEDNRVEIEVSKKELGNYGIAPEMGGMALPAKIGNTNAGVRFYQTPKLKLPWARVTVDIGFIKDLVEKIQDKPTLNSISSKLLSRFSDFSWDDIDGLFSMLDESGFKVEKLALKDIESCWVTTDTTDTAENTFFIKPYFMDELEKTVRVFLSTDYGSPSGPKATLIMIPINESVGPMMSGDVSKNIVHVLEEQDSKRNYVTMKATGSGVISYQIDELTAEANKIIAPGIFIAICIILLINFRKLSYMFLPLIGLSISLIWLFGTMSLLGIKFNAMAVALVPLLLGLGVDYSIHMFHSYRAELEKGNPPGKSMVTAINEVGVAMAIATITTVIAFLSFLTATVPPLREFGILCAIGIVYTFIVTVTLQAAVRYILDRREKVVKKFKPKKQSNGKAMRKLAVVICKYPLPLILMISLVTVVMAGGALNVQTGFNMMDFLPEDNPAVDVMMDVMEEFPFSSQSQEYIFLEGSVTSVETLKGISKTHENIRDDKLILETLEGEPKVKSILSIIQEAIKENNTIASKFNINEAGIPRSNVDVKQVYDYLYESDDYSMDVRQILHRDGKTYDATLLRIYTDFSKSESNDANENVGILYNELCKDLTEYGDVDAVVTGESSSAYTIINSLTESQIISTAISIILAALVLMIVYRNPVLGAIAIMPVAISIVWILGTIYFIGYTLNIMTIMVTCLTIGIGIDYAIHATERFRRVADKTGDSLKAVSETVGHTGGALLIAAMTTIAGFGMLILAPLPPEQQFGVIMCLTILYAFLTSIFILPPVIMKWGEWRKRKKGYIISPVKHGKNEKK
ncbi:MAG: MMPL family transporter [Candidatus Thermoplasmatota archaeon]|nr:MMPL family transporter [Candidatus Thermoplasmatota archaeon]